jgi:signal transduction histidine kinase
VRTVKAYHILFMVSLTTLFVLAGWWFLWHYSQVHVLHQEALDKLDLRARLLALELGTADATEPPRVPEKQPFVLVPVSGDQPPAGFYRLKPAHSAFAIGVRPDEAERLAAKLHRRMVMVVGEGSLLMFLVFICVLMLYRLLLSERRLRQELEVFFHAVSHELKTPVAGVRALLDTLASRQVKPDELARYAKLGLRETTRLQNLIENVLLSNRIDRQLFSARPRPVDLAGEVNTYVERRNDIFTSQKVELAIDEADGWQVEADPDLLRHVIGNLVDNAFKYSPKDPSVRMSLHQTDNSCMIDIEDNGIGFGDEDKPRLFEKFERGKDASVRHQEGSGLGLFIARELIRAMQGTIEAHSAGHGQGSRFRITLKKV